MLVNTKEVADRLQISNRAVQHRCIKAGLVKIGNQYQITKDIAEQWYVEAEQKKRTEPKQKQQNTKTSQRSNTKTSVHDSLIIGFLVIALVMVLALVYYNFYNQITKLNTEADQDKIEHMAEVKELTKKLNDAADVIQNQEIEIHDLKYKDSLRTFRRL
jgi:cell division protein FtsL